VLATMMLVGRSRATQLPAMVSTSVLVHGM
jgi:hypothetical protein